MTWVLTSLEKIGNTGLLSTSYNKVELLPAMGAALGQPKPPAHQSM